MEYIGGKQVVLEAIKSGHKIHNIYFDGNADKEIAKLAAEKGIATSSISDELKKRIELNQGCLALMENFNYQDLDVVLSKIAGDGLIVVLDHLEDPHNLGAIIRTALCGGVDAVIIPDDRCVRVNNTVLKVSAGSAFHLPVVKVKNINQVVGHLKKKGYWVYGADMDGKAPLFKTKLTGNICLVMGNEGKGISQIVKKNCDVLLSIPQVGPLGSLNVSVATGIIIYDVFRQRS